MTVLRITILMPHHGLGQKVHLGNFELLVTWNISCSQFSFKTNLKSIEWFLAKIWIFDCLKTALPKNWKFWGKASFLKIDIDIFCPQLYKTTVIKMSTEWRLGFHLLNREVFSRSLKVTNYAVYLNSLGKEFHVLGSQREKRLLSKHP